MSKQQIYQNKNEKKWNDETVYHNQLARYIHIHAFTVSIAHTLPVRFRDICMSWDTSTAAAAASV